MLRSRLIVALCFFTAVTAYVSRARKDGFVPSFLFTDTPLSTPLKSDTLTCVEMQRIAVWSASRFGGGASIDLRARATSDRLATNFLEKLDGTRLLITEVEAKSFRQGVQRAWTAALEHQRCDYFESWVARRLPELKAALWERLARVAVEAHFQNVKPSGDEETIEKRLKAFHGFAKDEKELTERLDLAVQAIARTTTPGLRAAYQKQDRRLVRETLEQILFENVPPATNLLAKAALGTFDPYSTYLSPSEFDDFYLDLAGGTSGIGVRVRNVPNGLLVQKVLAGTPAAKSKQIRPGDVIVRIDGRAVVGATNAMSKRWLQGPEGSIVKLDIKSGPLVKEVKIRRQQFRFEDAKLEATLISVNRHGKKAKVAVIEVPSFYGRGGIGKWENERSSAEDLERVLKSVLTKEPTLEAAVLDLRGNPGGYLEEAVSMAGLFVGSKPVVSIVEGQGEKQTERTLREPIAEPLYLGPLVVLVDEDSASAAEVLAGCLKDLGRAVVVGSKRTYGKGSVQKLHHLDEEFLLAGAGGKLGPGVVKLTSSLFYSPAGHSPANGGVKTQIVIEKANKETSTATHHAPERASVLEGSEAAEVQVRSSRIKKWVNVLSLKSEARRKARGDQAPVTDGKTLDDTAFEAARIGADLAELDADNTAQL